MKCNLDQPEEYMEKKRLKNIFLPWAESSKDR